MTDIERPAYYEENQKRTRELMDQLERDMHALMVHSPEMGFTYILEVERRLLHREAAIARRQPRY